MQRLNANTRPLGGILVRASLQRVGGGKATTPTACADRTARRVMSAIAIVPFAIRSQITPSFPSDSFPSLFFVYFEPLLATKGDN